MRLMSRVVGGFGLFAIVYVMALLLSSRKERKRCMWVRVFWRMWWYVQGSVYCTWKPNRRLLRAQHVGNCGNDMRLLLLRGFLVGPGFFRELC